MNYADDDILFARAYEAIHREKGAVSIETLKKRYWNNMNSRVKTPSYSNKGVKVIWTYEEYLQWWNDNFKRYELIVEHGLTPSIDRIDSRAHYEASNCRWLPNDLNRTLGEMEGLISRMKTIQTYLKENEEWLK